VRIATRHPDVGVAEQLLDHGHRCALVRAARRGRVPHRVRPRVRDLGRGQDVRPFLLVRMRIERTPVLLAEDDAEVLPHVGGGQAFALLLRAVRAELSDQRPGHWHRLAVPLLDLAEHQAATASLRALRGAALRAASESSRAGCQRASRVRSP
jgi:hypothetical protein